MQRLRGSEEGLGNSCGRHEGEVGRLREEHGRGDGDVLGIGAAVGEAKDGGPGEQMGGVAAGAEGDDGAAEFDAEGEGGLRREGVVAGALEEVHAVEAKGVDAHEGLAGGGGREGG